MNHNVTLKFGKKAICQKEYIKYLGINLDEHLKWKQHVLETSKKVSRGMGIIYRLRDFLNVHALKKIYYSLIYSHLVYAIEVWGSADVSLLDNLLTIQKKQ